LTRQEAKRYGVKGRQSGPILYAPHWRDAQLQDGTIFAARTGYRPQPAIFVNGGQDIRLDDITIHFAEGMGLLAQRSEDIHLERFSVELRPKGGRYFTTQADATHFVACRNIDIAPSDTIQ